MVTAAVVAVVGCSDAWHAEASARAAKAHADDAAAYADEAVSSSAAWVDDGDIVEYYEVRQATLRACIAASLADFEADKAREVARTSPDRAVQAAAEAAEADKAAADTAASIAKAASAEADFYHWYHQPPPFVGPPEPPVLKPNTPLFRGGTRGVLRKQR